MCTEKGAAEASAVVFWSNEQAEVQKCSHLAFSGRAVCRGESAARFECGAYPPRSALFDSPALVSFPDAFGSEPQRPTCLICAASRPGRFDYRPRWISAPYQPRSTWETAVGSAVVRTDRRLPRPNLFDLFHWRLTSWRTRKSTNRRGR